MTSTAALLLRRAAGGDPDALERLYATQVDALFALVHLRVGGDGPLAEDIVHDTFALALEQLDAYEPQRGSVRAWLGTLSRNVTRRHLLARRRTMGLDPRTLDPAVCRALGALGSEELADSLIRQRETRQLVALAMDALPSAYAELLVDKYVGGRSLSELAASERSTEAAVKSQLARARRAFRAAFDALTEPSGTSRSAGGVS